MVQAWRVASHPWTPTERIHQMWLGLVNYKELGWLGWERAFRWSPDLAVFITIVGTHSFLHNTQAV